MAPSVAGGATEAHGFPFRPGGAPWRLYVEGHANNAIPASDRMRDASPSAWDTGPPGVPGVVGGAGFH